MPFVIDKETGRSRWVSDAIDTREEKDLTAMPKDQGIETDYGVLRNVGQQLQEAGEGVADVLGADKDDNIIQGAIKTPLRMGYNAAANAVQEGSDTIRDLAEWSGIAPEGFGTSFDEKDKPILGFGESGWKPPEASTEEAWLSGMEGFGTGVAQFAVEWVMLSKALRGANWLIKGSKLGKLKAYQKATQYLGTGEKLVQARSARASSKLLSKLPGVSPKVSSFAGRRLVGPGVGAAYNATFNPKGMAIDFSGFDQWEGRLYDLAANSEWFGWVEHLPFAERLASDPNDSAMQGRMKNVAEGWLLDFHLGSLGKTIKALPTEQANLVVDSIRARGLTEKLYQAAQEFGSNSPEYQALKQQIADLGDKMADNPIVKAFVDESDEAIQARKTRIAKNRIENVPSQEVSYAREQANTKVQELEQKIKSLGEEPPKPEKGKHFEVINGKRVKTAESKANAAWNRKFKRLTNELNEVKKGLDTEIETKINEEDLGDAPELPDTTERQQVADAYTEVQTKLADIEAKILDLEQKAPDGFSKTQEKKYNRLIKQRDKTQALLDKTSETRKTVEKTQGTKLQERKQWNRRAADDVAAERVENQGAEGETAPAQTTGYSREQIQRAQEAVKHAAWPGGKPMSLGEKEMLMRRYLETKFGRLDKSMAERPKNRLYRGMSQEEYAAAIEARVALLSQIIEKVAGKDVQVRYHDVYGSTTRGVEYGGGTGSTESRALAGSYDFFDDVLDLYGMMEGSTKELVGTAFHETFHRIQMVSLPAKDIKILDNFWARLKTIVYTQLSGADQMSYMESMTHAYERYGTAKLFGKDPVYAMLANPTDGKAIKLLKKVISYFDPIFNLMEKIHNAMTNQSLEYFRSMRDIYEDAYNGKFADVVQPEAINEREMLQEYKRLTEDLPSYEDFQAMQDNLELGMDDPDFDMNLYYEADSASWKIHQLKELDAYTNDPNRALLHPGGIWRTRDEGFAKLPGAEADLLDGSITKNKKLRNEPLRSEKGGDFEMPNQWRRIGLNMGMAQITWRSNLERLAWVLRRNRKSAYPQTAPQMRDFLKQQGYNLDSIMDLGDQLHEELLAKLEDVTGSRKASPDNTRGVTIDLTDAEGPVRPEADDTIPKVEDYENTTENRAQEAEIPFEEAVEEPEQIGFERIEENLDPLLKNMKEKIEKLAKGEIELADIGRDIVAITTRGRKNRNKINQYSPVDINMQALFSAVSDAADNILNTTFKEANTQQIIDDLVRDGHNNGINLNEAEAFGALLRARFVTGNVQTTKQILKLRLAVLTTGRIAGTTAANILNAQNLTGPGAKLKYDEAARALEDSLQASLRIWRDYKDVMSSVGQFLQSAQAKVSDVDLKTTRADFDLNLRKADEYINNPRNGAGNDSIRQIMPDEVIMALETGEWTPRAKAAFTEFAKVISTESFRPGSGVQTIHKMMSDGDWKGKTKKAADEGDIDQIELFMKTLTSYRVSNILSAPLTYAVQTGIPLTRILFAPAIDLYNHSVVENGNLVDIDAGLKRLPVTFVWYRQIALEAAGALRLGRDAFIDGHSYYDPYRRAGAFDLNEYKSIEDAVNNVEKSPLKMEEREGAYNLNEMEWAKHITESNSQQAAANILHKFATLDLRAQGAIETAQKALAGNSFLYAIGFEEGFEKATREGLKGREAWGYAEEWARQKVDFHTKNALHNGKEITGAIMTHPAALKIGRVFTFTDDVRARMENRTFSYGQDLARASGIDENDFDSINDFAERYQQGHVDKSQGFQYKLVNHGISKFARKGETQLPASGDLTPAFTQGWSFLPHQWQRLQNTKMGWMATNIQPFVRTPADITKQALRAVPIANLTTDTFYRDFFDETSYFSKSWKAEMTIGATIGTALVAQLFNNEDMEWTGSGPLNGDMRRLWEADGRLPFSFRYKYRNEDGHQKWAAWQSYRAYEPVATLISTIADIHMLRGMISQDEYDTAMSSVVVWIASQALGGKLKNTYYSGVSDFIDGHAGFALGGFGRPTPQPGELNRFHRYWSDFVASWIPQSSRLKAAAQFMDPYKRTIENRVPRKEVDTEVGKGVSGQVWGWSGDATMPGKEYGFNEIDNGNIFQKMGNLMGMYLDKIKMNTPGWSRDLPVKLNYITGDPLYHPGFLHDDLLDLERHPWLTQLTASFVLSSAPAAYSWVPVLGSLPASQGKLGEEQYADAELGEEQKGKKDFVVRELMRLRGFGSQLRPPTNKDIQSGVTLSTDAYNQYLRYISQTPDPVTGKVLWEELFTLFTSERYKNAGVDSFDKQVRSPRASLMNPIWTRFKRNAIFRFLNDPNNPFVIEVLQERARQQELENNNAMINTFPGYTPKEVGDGGYTRTVSPSEYEQHLNR